MLVVDAARTVRSPPACRSSHEPDTVDFPSLRSKYSSSSESDSAPAYGSLLTNTYCHSSLSDIAVLVSFLGRLGCTCMSIKGRTDLQILIRVAYLPPEWKIPDSDSARKFRAVLSSILLLVLAV